MLFAIKYVCVCVHLIAYLFVFLGTQPSSLSRWSATVRMNRSAWSLLKSCGRLCRWMCMGSALGTSVRALLPMGRRASVGPSWRPSTSFSWPLRIVFARTTSPRSFSRPFGMMWFRLFMEVDSTTNMWVFFIWFLSNQDTID